MSKTFTIIRREYLSRVKKKSFIVMTILGPLLMAALIIVPIYIAQMSDSVYEVAIVDDTRLFYDEFTDANNVRFTDLNVNIDAAIELMKMNKFDAVLHIPTTAFQAPSTLRLFSEKAINMNAKLYIENVLRNEFELMKLAHAGIDPEILKATETKISIQAIRLLKDGHEQTDYPEISMALGIFSGILIYFFVFLFGAQVMRGVMEEKSNRIVEIIVSSVRPFQLMMGKIVGIALVGLTQFLIWIGLTFVIVGTVRTAMPETFRFTPQENIYISTAQSLNPAELQEHMQQTQQHNSPVGQLFESLGAINLEVMILSFIFFFLGGYLLYAALFAAIGSAVDNEADTQQFMLPITIPMIFAIVMAQMVMNNPMGPVAFWLSIIPLTSPIIMMVRIPFGVPWFDLWLSMVLLIAGFIATTWLAAKIYRTGILMYGKKVSYKDLWRWIKINS
ncbi:MAG: ABC transporter permease [Bacteroidetes bacterium]|nr:MAG: ABC transporter permease [Bacteroidota bacterium]